MPPPARVVTNGFLKFASVASLAWTLCWILLGGTTSGKSWYASNVASAVFPNDPKGGLPLLALAFPVLIPSTLIVLLARRPSSPRAAGTGGGDDDDSPSGGGRGFASLLSALPDGFRRCILLINGRLLDNGIVRTLKSDPERQGFLLMFLPLSVYTVCCIFRHLSGNSSMSTNIKEIANAFGMAAVVALGLVVLPSTRRGPFTMLFGACPAAVLKSFHIWLGRFVVLATLVHGITHVGRYAAFAPPVTSSSEGASWIRILIPPPSCWNNNSGDNNDALVPDCSFVVVTTKTSGDGGDDEDGGSGVVIDKDLVEDWCTCYARGRNFTGILAGLGVLLIAVTSLKFVRRSFYSLFYSCHVAAIPIIFIGAALHYNRTMLYVAGGALYYLASSVPAWLENRRCRNGIQIVSVRRIPPEQSTSSDRPCVSITFAATGSATSKYRPGQHLRLWCREIAPNAHPFTCNLVPTASQQEIRVVFRVSGPFTKKFANRLLSSSGSSGRQLPVVQLDGFHGPVDRVRQVMYHDLSVIVAGGIGITPYLSLLHSVYQQQLQLHVRKSKRNGNNGTRSISVTGAVDVFGVSKKVIVLHWICREASLIEYVKHEYFDPLMQMPQLSGFEIQILIHYTGHDKGNARPSYTGDLQEAVSSTGPDDGGSSGVAAGMPFAPSCFTPASHTSFRSNLVVFVPYALTVSTSLYAVWYLYSNVQDGNEVVSRIWAPIAALIIALVVSVSVGAVLCSGVVQEEETENHEWTPVLGKSFDDDDVEMATTMEMSCQGSPTSDANSSSAGRAGSPLPLSTTRGFDRPERIGDSPELASADEDEQTVMLEERNGRPTIHQLVQPLDKADRPGLFMCGPASLMNRVRDTVEARCSLRIRQCSRRSCRVAVYEETFEL